MNQATQTTQEFLEHQRAFRLGGLLTESSHPKTAQLSQVIEKDVVAGIRLLLQVDEEIAPAAKKVFEGEPYRKLVKALTQAFINGKQVFFTGCGATGRLSILLEAAWREFWQRLQREQTEQLQELPELENSVISVMAGGDYALIKSVEGFEDFPRFGRHQLIEAGVTAGDVVVAITEGGETPFVVGTAWQGLDSGADVFFVYNNPSELLVENVERSREVIEEERITCLDLTTGPMAVSGSTRMQATSCELLVVGTAMETALKNVVLHYLPNADLSEWGFSIDKPIDYAESMNQLVDQLCKPTALQTLANFTQYEQNIYKQNGLVTYTAIDYLLDVLTDTTERSPTFSLPAYRRCNDTTSAISWAFVKNPLHATEQTWQQTLRREPRGLEWTAEIYSQLEAPESIQSQIPELNNEKIYEFQIGNEFDATRFQTDQSALIMIAVGEQEIDDFDTLDHPLRKAFEQQKGRGGDCAVVSVGRQKTKNFSGEVFHIPTSLPRSPINLWEHLAIKLVLNTVSTATMARLRRIEGNWMIHVNTSNKKLIDRGTRLIAELSGLSYEESCLLLHQSIEEVKPYKHLTSETTSPVALTLRKLGFTKQ